MNRSQIYCSNSLVGLDSRSSKRAVLILAVECYLIGPDCLSLWIHKTSYGRLIFRSRINEPLGLYTHKKYRQNNKVSIRVTRKY